MSLGVDLLHRTRLAGRDEEWLARFDRRHLAPAERTWVRDDPPLRRLVCIAAKEAYVKLLGQRPPNFEWPSVVFRAGDGVPSDAVLESMCEVLGASEHGHGAVARAGGADTDRAVVRVGRVRCARGGARAVTSGDEHLLVSNGAALAVYTRGAPAGTAPTIVLVHRFAETSREWDGVADRLAEHCHVVTVDARGTGRSTRGLVPRGNDMRWLVDDIDGVARAASPDRPVHLVGHGWGAAQGWEYVTDPDRAPYVASFTSIGGPCLDHASYWIRRRLRRPSPRNLWGVARLVLRATGLVLLSVPVLGAVLWLVASGLQRLRLRVRHGQWLRVPPTRPFGFAVLRRLVAPRARSASVPVHVVTAASDGLAPAALFDDIERWCDDVSRTVVPGGHRAPRTHPDQMAGAIAAFVATLESRGRRVPVKEAIG